MLMTLVLISIGNLVFAQENKSTQYVEKATSIKTSNDPAFPKMLTDSIDYINEFGRDKFYDQVHRLIFKGEIESMFGQNKSWDEIEKTLQEKYGVIGEEAYLKTRITVAIKAQQRQEYLPLVKRLLEKYSSHLSDGSRLKYQQLMKESEK